MKYFKLTFLLLCLLYFAACEQPNGLDGNDPNDTDIGNETEEIEDNIDLNDFEDGDFIKDDETIITDDDVFVDIDEDIDDEESEDIVSVFAGNGTMESPYLITTAEDLREFSNRVNTDKDYAYSHYRLTANIDLQGIEWIPIGTDKNRFFGTLDGSGHSITGLNITEERTDNGLFGVIGKDGKVINIGVSGTITNGDNSGGIVGNNFGTVENCYSTVTVYGEQSAGGITGFNRSGSKIIRCYSTGNISSDNFSGGIVGRSVSSASIRYSVSLSLIINSGENIGRISGNNLGSYTQNKALSVILLNCVITTGTDKDYQGADIFYGTPLSSIFNTWDTTVWHIPDGELTADGQLPTLR